MSNDGTKIEAIISNVNAPEAVTSWRFRDQILIHHVTTHCHLDPAPRLERERLDRRARDHLAAAPLRHLRLPNRTRARPSRAPRVGRARRACVFGTHKNDAGGVVLVSSFRAVSFNAAPRRRLAGSHDHRRAVNPFRGASQRRSVSRSLDRSIARSCSISLDLARSRSVARSLDRSIDNSTTAAAVSSFP